MVETTNPARSSISGIGTSFAIDGGGTYGGGYPEILPSGVTPGSYTSANITVNAAGQIISCSNGTGGGGGGINPGTTNQLTYYATNGDVVSGLNLGTNLSITAGVLNAAGGGGGGGVNPGTTNELAYYAADGSVVSGLILGTNLSITSGVLNATGGGGGGGGLPFNNVTTSTQLLAVNNGYITNNGPTLVTFTLPTTASIGQVVAIVGNSAGGWKITQNSGQQIIVGSGSSTIGTSGYLASDFQYDCVELICVTANTTFVARSLVGNLGIN
jgi:hypothetical protein